MYFALRLRCFVPLLLIFFEFHGWLVNLHAW
jgi:hypothetical protein